MVTMPPLGFFCVGRWCFLRRVDSFDQHPCSWRIDKEHASGLTFVAAGPDEYGVTFLILHNLLSLPHSTSGARETIFMNCFSRSSRATGPKIRVPRGSFCSLMITAALSRKPDQRTIFAPERSALVRTTTALQTSDFFTVPPGIASLTATTMMSPIGRGSSCDRRECGSTSRVWHPSCRPPIEL